jgi:hypothetical protein
MSNAARRVLELFLHPPKRGVTGVTGVTRPFVTPKSSTVTPVTPVTYQKQHPPVDGVTGVTAARGKLNFEAAERTLVMCDDKLPWPRTCAETPAFEARIIQWLNRNPAPSPAGRCAWCGQLESESAGIVPFGTEPGTHSWLHGECWRPWQEARRAEAVKALSRIGDLAGAAPSGRA